MKILLSACPFHLVNWLETTAAQHKFNPFLDWDILFMKKEYVDRTWLIGSLSYYFTLFRTWETNLQNRTCGVFFLSLLDSLNMKRTELSLSLNSIKHQIETNLSIMTRPIFTFVRLIKTSHSNGFTRRVELYNKHMLSSSILIKNKEVLVSNHLGKWEKG